MIPIKDLNPRRRTPFVTYALVAINLFVFFWQLSLSQRELLIAFRDLSVVPFLYSRDPLGAESLMDGLRSMFFHGGWLHLGSNMLYLWVFGDNVEDRLGHLLYLAVYIISGYMAILAQVLVSPDSFVPMVGASGAIAGVLGSYIVQFPTAKIRSLVLLVVFVSFIDLPAYLVLGFWFVSQLFSGVASLGLETSGGGVAFFAHIGGFVAGMILMSLYNLVAPPYATRASIPFQPSDFPATRSIIMPETRLSPQEASQRQLLIRQLATLGSRPVEIITPHYRHFGHVVGISPTSVTLRTAQGQVVNIALHDVVDLHF